MSVRSAPPLARGAAFVAVLGVLVAQPAATQDE
jgi:hypothetical protein